MQGMIFDIQRYSLEDGPGIRTTVFLKGCPLHCAWCSNPESQSPQAEIGWFERRCAHCGHCADVCSRGAIHLSCDRVQINRARCDLCGRCADVCTGDALQIFGRRVRAQEILQTVQRDRDYYALSGGGMTLSGGDVAAQPAFAAELLRLATDAGIDTALETCAMMPTPAFLPLARLANRVYVDLKLADSEKHRRWTGHANAMILQNIHALRAQNLPLTVRTPLIPGINTSRESIRQAAQMLKAARIEHVELLPYHRLGLAKYSALDRPYPLPDLAAMSAAEARELARIYADYGIDALVIGS